MKELPVDDSLSFETLPHGTHLGEEQHGRSPLFLILLLVIIILFGGYLLVSEFLLQKNASPKVNDTLSSRTLYLESELSSLEKDLSATVIGDYSSLF